MLTIEFEPPEVGKCNCCGDDLIRLTRFVYQDGDAFAYYYALLEGHTQPRVALLLVVMCEWDEAGEEIIRKTGFPLRIQDDGESYQVGLLEAEQCPWQDLPEVQILGRNESLPHPFKADVFHITDHIMQDDQAVIDYVTHQAEKSH